MMMDNNNIIINQLISLTTTLSTYLPLTPLATLIGLTCLIAQINITLLLDKKRCLSSFLWNTKRNDSNITGPWNDLPGFTAHQLIALPSMCILTYCGIKSWFFTDDTTTDDNHMDTPYQRIFGQSNPHDIPLAIGSGAILLWDIPSSYFIKELNDPLMGLHHLGMFMVATVMGGMFCSGSGGQEQQQMIGYYYVPYYFGVIEMSSVPLSYVDVFHPKYKYYYEWLNNPKTQNQTKMKILQGVNEGARILFAILFLILRGVYFPYVTFYHAIPDLWIGFNYSDVEGRPQVPDTVPLWTGYFLICAVSSFAILQCYWGILILKQIYKLVWHGDSSDVGGSPKKKTMKKE